MFWRQRKVLRDRASGMVFDWRRGHGSTQRLLLAALVSASAWGVLLSYVRVREPQPVDYEDEQIDLTLVDLDHEGNRWLSELIDRETLFQQRWEVANSETIAMEVARALFETSPRIYKPTLREMPLPENQAKVSHLPGWEAGELPEPDRVATVTLAPPAPNWWIEVGVIEGAEGLAPFEFPFRLLEDLGTMSEGESWVIVVAVDWRGAVVSINGWWERADEPRTAKVLEEIRAHSFPPFSRDEDLRIWRLEARLVNRPLPR